MTKKQRIAILGSLVTSLALGGTWGEEMGAFVDLRGDQPAQTIQELGLGWVRIMYSWNWVEPAPGKFLWGELDQWIARAKKYDLKVLLVVQGSPAWANGGHGPYDKPSALKLPPKPEFYANYTNFVAGLVRHGVDAIEVWNEPNAGFWEPEPNPEEWANLVVMAYDAVKVENPAIPVISGGVCPVMHGSKSPNAPENYLRKAFEAVPELKTHVDGIGHHPYVFANDPTAKDPLTAPYQWNSILWTETMHQLLVENGIGEMPFWFTEFGVPTGGPFGAVSEDESGTIFAHYFEAFDRLEAKGIRLGPMFFWTLFDSAHYQKANAIEGWEGIYNLEGKPKASVEVIRARAKKER